LVLLFSDYVRKVYKGWVRKFFMRERNIVYKVHSTYGGGCGVGIFTKKEMEVALDHPRVGSVIFDAHYRNKDTDLPLDLDGAGIKYTTCLNDVDIDVERKADEALADADAAKKVGQTLVGYFAHEYGIFRDGKGEDLLMPLMRAYHKRGLHTIFHPHTVLKNPDDYGSDYKEILEGAVQTADLILGMTPSAITMMEEIYGAPRESMIYNPHGVQMFPLGFSRPNLKKKCFGRSDFDLWISSGFFSAGKKIDDAVRALKMYSERTGDYNWKYLVLGLHKDKEHVEKCYSVAESLGLNPAIIGEGKKDVTLERLASTDLKDNNVIFFDAFPDVESSHKAKIMSNGVFVVNESPSQISSGEIVKALSAGRVAFSYESPIAEDLSGEGGGVFSIEHSNPSAFADSIYHFKMSGDKAKRRSEKSSLVTSKRFQWSKTARDFVDATAAIIDKDEEDRLEQLVLG